MARLLEDEALAILARGGVAVPRWEVAASEDEAACAAERVGTPVVLKALIPIGGRGKAGLVRKVSGREQTKTVARELLTSHLNGFPVRRLLVMEHLEIVEELFASFTFDSVCRGPVVVFSRGGGIDIEQHVCEGSTVLMQRPIDILCGLLATEAGAIALEAGLSADLAGEVAELLPRLYAVFRSTDACLVEINPLVLTTAGHLGIAAAVIDVDDLALFRHPEFAGQLSDERGTGLRPFTPLEQRIREIDRADPDVGAIRFLEFPDGDVGCLVTSGGASLIALGEIFALGERPANAFDITPGPNEEKIYRATRALLGRSGLRGLIAGGNVKNFTRVDIHVRAIVRALRDARVDLRHFPVVLRFAGPGIEEAREAVHSIPGLELYEDDVSLTEAVRRLIERIRSSR